MRTKDKVFWIGAVILIVLWVYCLIGGNKPGILFFLVGFLMWCYGFYGKK